MDKNQIKKIDLLFKLMEHTGIDPVDAGIRAGVSRRTWEYWRSHSRIPSDERYDAMWNAVVELAREHVQWADGMADRVGKLGVVL